MSTRSYIGLKEGTKITFIYCHSGGSLDINGVILNMFYKDVNKVKSLISLGNVSSIGYNIDSPNSFNQYDDYIRNEVTRLMDNHIKTSFTYAYCRDRNEKEDGKPYKTNLKKFLEQGEEYNYLFDVEKNKWYLTYMKNSKKLVYDLNKVLTDENYFSKCILETDIEGDFQRIQNRIAFYKADLKINIITKYNAFLRKNGIQDVEIDYVKGNNGERVFGLLLKESGKQRRKVIMRNSCIGLLCYNLFNLRYGKYYPYERLSFTEVYNLSAPLEEAIPLF